MVTLYIPLRDQYLINGEQMFKHDGRRDVFRDLLKNNVPTLRELARLLGYKPSRMKKGQIYELIRHVIVFENNAIDIGN